MRNKKISNKGFQGGGGPLHELKQGGMLTFPQTTGLPR
ncbi:unnamed protein product, partial [Musa banksii]